MDPTSCMYSVEFTKFKLVTRVWKLVRGFETGPKPLRKCFGHTTDVVRIRLLPLYISDSVNIKNRRKKIKTNTENFPKLCRIIEH